MTRRPPLSGPQLFNMSFGFLGIQFGWGLQLANMSAVYERLGARPDATLSASMIIMDARGFVAGG